MSGSVKFWAMFFLVALTLGIGCARKNPTPFVLPTNSPPAPQINKNSSTTTDPEAKRQVGMVGAYFVALEGTPIWVKNKQMAEDLQSNEAWAKAKRSDLVINTGCNDYLVLNYRFPSVEASQAAREGLVWLFAASDDDLKSYGGLHNSLASVHLRADQIVVSSSTLDIRGNLSSAGVCDDPRIRGQIERTAALYGITDIRLNGSSIAWRCFGDQSGKCR